MLRNSRNDSMRCGRYETALPPVANHKKNTLRNSHAAVRHCVTPKPLWQRDALLSEARSNLPWSLANLSLWTFTQHAPSTPAKARGQVAWQLCCPCCVQKSSVDIAPEAGSITTPVSEIAGSSVSMRASKATNTRD